MVQIAIPYAYGRTICVYAYGIYNTCTVAMHLSNVQCSFSLTFASGSVSDSNLCGSIIFFKIT